MKNTTYIKLMALVLAFGVTYGHAGQQKRGLQRVKDAFRASDYTKKQWQSGNRLKAIGSYLGGYKDSKKTFEKNREGSVATSTGAFTGSNSVDEFLSPHSGQPFTPHAGASNVRQMARQASLRRLPSQASVRTMAGGGGQESAVQQASAMRSPAHEAAFNDEMVATIRSDSARLRFDTKAQNGKLTYQHFQDAISSAEARRDAQLKTYKEMELGEAPQRELSKEAQDGFLKDKAALEPSFAEKAKLPKIQALVRGHLARKKLDDEAKQKKAARQIQSIWRGSRVRKANAPEPEGKTIDLLVYEPLSVTFPETANLVAVGIVLTPIPTLPSLSIINLVVSVLESSTSKEFPVPRLVIRIAG